MCDVKEDQYYCLDDAVKYLQTRKSSQRKQCKLYYTHSKEEISSVIKHVNERLQDDSDDESSSASDSESIPIKRISELGKEDASASRRNKEQPPPVASPPPPSTSMASSGPGRPRLSAPNVPPGTSINVSSFSLVRK